MNSPCAIAPYDFQRAMKFVRTFTLANMYWTVSQNTDASDEPKCRKPGDRRDRGPRGYATPNPARFNMARFAHPKNLEAAYTILKAKGGKGPGLDGLTFDDLTTAELHEMFRGVSQAIKTRTYKPHPVRHVEIPKANGKKRLLSIPTIADRTAAKAFLICLDSFFKKLLPGVGRSTHRLFAQMDKVMRERKHFVLAIDDIRDCFPSAPIDKVVEIFRGHISQPDLIWLFESIVRGQEGPERVTGLDQGSPVSPVGMELLLHSCLDAEMEFRHQGKTQLLRYVDNLTFVTGSVREGEEALRLANETLDETGFTLKGEDGEPQDIRDLGHNRILLGLRPVWKDGQLVLAIPESTFQALGQILVMAEELPKPMVAAKVATRGWIHAVAPALTNSVAPQVVNRVLSITRQFGFSGISHATLTRDADQSRSNWQRTLRSFR